MEFSLWSALLIASTSQCFFLMFFLLRKGGANVAAKKLLLALLVLVSTVNMSNLITATGWYVPLISIAGFARGMVLLFGPLFYLYVRSIIDPDFRLKWLQVLHFTPYLAAIAVIRIQNYGVTDEQYIGAIDWLLDGTVPMTWNTTIWFLLYFVQLMVYLILVRKDLIQIVETSKEKFQIDLQHRMQWLKKLNVMFIAVALLFLGITIYCLVTNTYTITGNLIYTTLLGIVVYLVAYQAVLDKKLLTPNFKVRYSESGLSADLKLSIKAQLLELFEVEKVFTDPDIKIADVAKRLATKPYVVSKLINSEFEKTFSEFLNDYRIQEFKLRIVDRNFDKFSIMGVASEVGYNSKSTFNTVFKKLTGQTPSDYVSQSRTEN